MNKNRKVEHTPTGLFEVLKFGQSSESLKSFSKSPKGMGNVIRRLTPAFRKRGVTIIKSDTGKRLYTITNTKSG